MMGSISGEAVLRSCINQRMHICTYAHMLHMYTCHICAYVPMSIPGSALNPWELLGAYPRTVNPKK
jgi:hypothetical protein